MKIAFASTDKVHVNQHFGWAKMFYLYEIIGDEYKFLEELDSSIEIDEEIEKLTYKISCIEEKADIVYVSQIGPKAANMVKMQGVFPLKASSEEDKIEDVLKSLIKLKNSNPPIWMRRLINEK